MADEGRSDKDVVKNLEEAEAEDEKLAQRLREDRSKVVTNPFGGSGATRVSGDETGEDREAVEEAREQREAVDESKGAEYL